MKPQPPYGHQKVRDIVEEVAQSSIMRLDPVSMSKLWDLITMVFKWQITLSSDLIRLTSRHLYELDACVVKENTRLQLQRVQNIVANFGKIFTREEQNALREEVLDWLKPFNIRVSLLLRLGLQNEEGAFVVNNKDPVAQEMLSNLGENIYMVAENGRGQRRNSQEIKTDDNVESEVNEMKIFADQIIGEKRRGGKEKMLTLSINKERVSEGFAVKSRKFDEVEVDKDDNRVSELLEELNVSEDADINLKEDLLEMISNENHQ